MINEEASSSLVGLSSEHLDLMDLVRVIPRRGVCRLLERLSLADWKGWCGHQIIDQAVISNHWLLVVKERGLRLDFAELLVHRAFKYVLEHRRPLSLPLPPSKHRLMIQI